MNSKYQKYITNRITIFLVGSGLITAILLAKLFQLQIIQHDYYQQIATTSQYGFIELPAQRGEIIIKDYHSNEEFSIATNTTLNLLYADPVIIKDPVYIADKIAPLIFSIEEERAADNERIKELSKNLSTELTEEEINKILTPLTDIELETQFKQVLIERLSEKHRKKILLVTDMKETEIKAIQKLNLSGLEIEDKSVSAYPSQISQIAKTAEKLAPHLLIPSKKLEKILKGENRYVILKRKLDPKISDQISKLIKDDKNDQLTGLAMKEEYFRYYPEGKLAANVIGYVNHENIGQYGIESTFNTPLAGISGKLQTKKDSVGRQITVGESNLQAAVDGDNIILTIDRSVQLYTEKILEEDTKNFRADSGQVIIMDPRTGKVLAMANYPSFDPNNYGEVFKKIEINLTPEEIKNLYPTKDKDIYYFYTNEITMDKYIVFETKDKNGISSYSRYENFQGPEAYHNKIISWPYEPGSVFKTIAMSAALDDGDVTPNTTYNDTGPVGVDWNIYKQAYDYEIKNSTNKYWGLTNMKTVIAKSLNTGMTFVAKKMGPALFYSYLKKFGFLDRTDIELENEVVGKIEYFEDWTESELATHAFGQGLTVTMMQMASAYSAIANGGILMQPYLVEETRHDNSTVTKTEPKEIRRVISEDTSSKMTAMLVNTIESGEGKKGSVNNHFTAGKTGTSQTYKYGKAIGGPGNTIGTFAGFGPIDDPQFIIIVKYDRPRSSEWGSSTAAETFSKIADYLFGYYGLPPDK
ncbi:MAG: penicillin-binding protein 2 [Patescibacteria group bacterium]